MAKKRIQTPSVAQAEPLASPAPQVNATTNISSPAPIPEMVKSESAQVQNNTPPVQTATTTPSASRGTAEAVYNPSEDNLYRNLEQAYGENIAQYGTMVDYWERLRKEKQQADAEARKREGRIAFISSLGDAISGVVNLVGVSKGASNQKLNPVAPGLQNRYAALQDARKKEIDGLTDRLDKIKQDEANAKLAMKLGLTEFGARRQQAAEEAAAKDAALAEQKRQFDVSAGLKEQGLKIDELNARTNYIRTVNAGKNGGTSGSGRSSGSKNEYITIPDGNRGVITLTKNNLEAVKSWGLSTLRNDAAVKAGFDDWNDYLDSKNNRKRMNKVSPSAETMLSELSMVQNDDDLVNLINQYGSTSEEFMRQLRTIGSYSHTGSADAKQTPVGDEAYDEFK